MNQIKIKLFGAYRNITDEDHLYVEVEDGADIESVKLALYRKIQSLDPRFSNKGLIDDSVLATEEEVLDAGHVIRAPCTLAVLPPVCGG